MKRLKAWHREAIRQTYLGRQPYEIAENLRKTRQTIYSLLRDPLFKAELADYEEAMKPYHVDPKARFIELTPKAINTLEVVMDQEEDISQRRMAANDILDRAGYGRTTTLNSAGGLTVNIPIGQINLMLDALRESGELATDITATSPGPES